MIWFREIKTEGVSSLRRGLRELKRAGFRFKSVTLDGRRGFVETIGRVLGPVPVQMCLYHQKAIIRRYITDRPQSPCGQELKEIMKTLCQAEPELFIDRFYCWKHRHRHFLEERNPQGGYQHGKLHSAARSLQENLHRLFTYKDIPDAEIPSTINYLEGGFSHLKEKIKIHRGLSQNRKKKAIRSRVNHPK